MSVCTLQKIACSVRQVAVKKQSSQAVATSKPDECTLLQNSDGGDTEDVFSSDSQSNSPPNSIMSLSEDEISKGNLFLYTPFT